MRSIKRLLVSLLAAVVLFPLGTASPAAAADTRPNFHAPFPCGSTGWWYFSRPNHGTSNNKWPLDINWGSGSADKGKLVVASAGGTVVTAGDSLGTVKISHGNGWYTIYRHMSPIVVSKNQVVASGAPIGYVNSVGADAVHLHYEQLHATGSGSPVVVQSVFDGAPAVYTTTQGSAYLPASLNCPGTSRSQAEAYVSKAFLSLLGRAPDAEGLTFWSDRLVNGTSTYADVANGITGSQEYRGNLIDAAYRQYLGRGVDAGGLSTWLAQMNAGVKIEDVQANLLGSQEALGQAGGTAAGWVASLYQKVLGRGAGQSEIDFWVGQLNGGASMVGVASGFLYSAEHLNGVVNGYYVALLGRSADAGGLATWVGQIQSGVRDEQVIAALVSSDEFLSHV